MNTQKDLYLNSEKSYNRLLDEYKKYKSLIIAVDFDDTLYDFHKVGATFHQMKKLVNELFEIGFYIIIWTGNKNLDFVRTYLKENKINYSTINEDALSTLQYVKFDPPRKLYANAYLDDRAGLLQVYNDLNKLIKEIKNE